MRTAAGTASLVLSNMLCWFKNACIFWYVQVYPALICAGLRAQMYGSQGRLRKRFSAARIAAPGQPQDADPAHGGACPSQHPQPGLAAEQLCAGRRPGTAAAVVGRHVGMLACQPQGLCSLVCAKSENGRLLSDAASTVELSQADDGQAGGMPCQTWPVAAYDHPCAMPCVQRHRGRRHGSWRPLPAAQSVATYTSSPQVAKTSAWQGGNACKLASPSVRERCCRRAEGGRAAGGTVHGARDRARDRRGGACAEQLRCASVCMMQIARHIVGSPSSSTTTAWSREQASRQSAQASPRIARQARLCTGSPGLQRQRGGNGGTPKKASASGESSFSQTMASVQSVLALGYVQAASSCNSSGQGLKTPLEMFHVQVRMTTVRHDASVLKQLICPL